ncbi:MAG: acetyltransferase-like isoleucine patch superfamily enzyme [Cryomorphaceae bacterium]|jgi:galactoside O-acetyltransferase
MAYLSKAELNEMGFANIGENVLISNKCSIYNPHLISVGNNVRIDDFAVISPSNESFEIGNFVHIATHCSLIGRASIKMKDFSGLSGRVSIYSSSDDYSGEFMTNPTVPEEYSNVISKPVQLGKHVIVGAGTVILPGVSIGDGSAISALALVNRDIPAGVISGGTPCRTIKPRKTGFLDLGKELNSRNL